MKKERVFYLDFIRGISVIFIVVFHYNIALSTHLISGNEILFTNYKNGSLGQIGVSLFFIISGAALMYTYEKNFSIKEYIKKRFISIYPMFWIAYTITFLYLFYINRMINRDIPKNRILLTLIGFDGYSLYKVPNFYLLGEWFLGCIILCYIFFPILRRLLLDKPKTLILCVVVFHIIFVKYYNFTMQIDRNIFNQLPSFIFGMFFIKYLKKINIYEFTICMITCILMFTISIPINGMYKVTIMGVSSFGVLVYISQYLDIHIFKYIFYLIGKYSYAIFLVHHVTIDRLMTRFNSSAITRFESYCLFIIIVSIIIFFSLVLYYLNNIILRKYKHSIVKILSGNV
ncbi:acyltransferase family protein [Clostridium butyricum]|uniref:acyltransferase family protein n=2 Tax=Clostridium butyricum TaxID=1492 RepID=UPI003466EEC9